MVVSDGDGMKKAILIGMAGESAGGKSTAAESLKEKLAGCRVKVIHMDDYYREESARPVILGCTDGKRYIDDNHPDALDLDRVYVDVERSREGQWDVVIVEGLFALWDERIFRLMDLKVFVDCDSDERLVRRLKRQLSYGQSQDKITERYIQAVQPRQREYVSPTKWKADMILNGFRPSSEGIDLIACWINHRMRDSRD